MQNAESCLSMLADRSARVRQVTYCTLSETYLFKICSTFGQTWECLSISHMCTYPHVPDVYVLICEQLCEERFTERQKEK